MASTTYDQDTELHSKAIRIARRPGVGVGDGLIEAARTSATDVPVVSTGPAGHPGLEPLVLCTIDDQTALYPNADVDDVPELVESLESGELPTAGASEVLRHEQDGTGLLSSKTGALAVGERRVLGSCGWIDSTDPTEHEFLTDDVAVDRIADLGLLGRGRGDAATDAPVAKQWTTALETDGEPVVVVNANEADERARADALLVASVPFTVLDAATTVASHVDATELIVYVNETDDWLHEHLHRVIEAGREYFDIVPTVVSGPDSYRAGEPTMALEALEGADRIEARRGPPGPASHGLYGRPTVLHTPRTFAQIYQALVDPSAFDEADPDPGTRLVTVTGDVEAPATVELPTGRPLSTITDAVELTAGSAEQQGTLDFEAAVVGGQFGGFTADLDVSVEASSLRDASLGTNESVELLAESRCVVAEVGERAKFAAAENCGRCVPCREGSTQLLDVLREVYDGEYDAAGIRELTRVMERSSICDFGVETARMVASAVDEFESEFRAHANGHCPSKSCDH
ncbi:NADH-ubiquinone oxidoreductase-F iron-sulfur binding region domain-containing protein [Halobellus sp. Atlit-38R]|uniref:NADH-ubiquinone oxidoreductase-F iron-sulfur binding region domain-containing protein n=1 Tax=Halobellus sp. Atlit-38R TaxID=2282131 RepID=UPI001F3137AC|nr:NADH-ubiquinone oxidoreductase-F iron-sulfur binding region domain-containing protein [Halobellus sp. Atlit-38R]